MSIYIEPATRAYTMPAQNAPVRKPRPPEGAPDFILAFDCETRRDTAQALTFGVYRVYCRCRYLSGWRGGRARENPADPNAWGIVEEGLFYPDDLPASEVAVLREYVERHASDVPVPWLPPLPDPDPPRAIEWAPDLIVPSAYADLVEREGMAPGSELPILQRPDRERLVLRTLEDWERHIWHRLAYKVRALVVSFNLPFDLSRIAATAHAGGRGKRRPGELPVRDKQARGNKGAWVLSTAQFAGRQHQWHPAMRLRAIDGKRTLISFQRPARMDTAPEWQDREDDDQWAYQGRFLDLRTLAFALTSESHSLQSACRAFGVPGKLDHEPTGMVTPEEIAYARQDVRATYALYEALTAAYDQYRLEVPPWRVFSPASIGKAILRLANVRVPDILPLPDLDVAAVYGAGMQSYYGGRSEVHIRWEPVPVVYLDCTSMYPTVNALLGQWDLLTAQAIGVEECGAEIARWLDDLRLGTLRDPAAWRLLPAITEVLPDDEILPTRFKTDQDGGYTIGVDHYRAAQAQWYTLADVAAAKILGGRAPRIRRAWRFVPSGEQDTRTMHLPGGAQIDPRCDDLFVRGVEERQRVKRRLDDPATTSEERERLKGQEAGLKTLLNSAGYGIYVEMNRQDGTVEGRTIRHGPEHRWAMEVEDPEEVGEYFCPMLATCITGAARLLLALLERLVADAGGTYALCDTDSLVIVATPEGGMVPCDDEPSGRIKALSWSDVERIRRWFAPLNPYAPDAVRPEDLWKMEKVNFVPGVAPRRQRQIWCYAVSAKRYCLFTRSTAGDVTIVKASEHGLGHLLPPYECEELSAEHGLPPHKVWIADAWQDRARHVLGLPVPERQESRHIATARLTNSTPDVGKTFTGVNWGKPYARQIKPFNFLMVAFPHQHETIHPIAPYERDPEKRERAAWFDARTEKRITLTTSQYVWDGAHRVQTYAEILERHWEHPERKSGTADGQPCRWDTRGLLHRLHLEAITPSRAIGKESNRMEDAVLGVHPDPEHFYQEYEERAVEEQSSYREYAAGDDLQEALRLLWHDLPLADLAKDAHVCDDTLRAFRDGVGTLTRPARERISQEVRIWLLCRLRDDLAVPAFAQSLAGMALAYRKGIVALHDECHALLVRVADYAGMRAVAGRLGVSAGTVHRWRHQGLPRGAATLTAVRERLGSCRQIVEHLAGCEARLGEVRESLERLREWDAADPHTPYRHWRDRSSSIYDAALWREHGRLHPPRPGLPTVDYQTILDREATQRGEDVPTFMQGIEAQAREGTRCAPCGLPSRPWRASAGCWSRICAPILRRACPRV
jgi:hypothetical protein